MPLAINAPNSHIMPGRDAARIVADTPLTVFLDTKFTKPLQITRWQAEAYLKELGQKHVALVAVPGGGLLITKPTRVR